MRRKLAAVAVVIGAGCTLGGCGSISDALSHVIADNLPAWAGGLPENAPPRPGDPRYEEFMREQMAKRLDADTAQQATKPTSEEPAPPTQPSAPAVAAADPPANKPATATPPARAPTGSRAVRASAGDGGLNIHSIY